jgi:hypothetical protein
MCTSVAAAKSALLVSRQDTFAPCSQHQALLVGPAAAADGRVNGVRGMVLLLIGMLRVLASGSASAKLCAIYDWGMDWSAGVKRNCSRDANALSGSVQCMKSDRGLWYASGMAPL